MDPLGARQILQALVQGFDPVTGAELPAGTVVQHAEVIRALLAGIAALEANAVRTRRRAQLPQNVGRPWSPAEEARLSAAFRSGEKLPAVAARHRRTVAALEARLERLGLLAPEERTTRNRYVTRSGPSAAASPAAIAPAADRPAAAAPPPRDASPSAAPPSDDPSPDVPLSDAPPSDVSTTDAPSADADAPARPGAASGGSG